jgi:hypothetical protein
MTAVPPDAEGQQESTRQAADEPGDESAVEQQSDAEATVDEASVDEASVDEASVDERTGVAAADGAAARLRDLDGAPVEAHVEIYEDAHRRLEEGLADLDER